MSAKKQRKHKKKKRKGQRSPKKGERTPKKENGLQGNAINDFYFSTTGYVYHLHLL